MKNQILMKIILICVLLFLTGAVYAQNDPFNTADSGDFTTGQRWLTWALNSLPPGGIGSYVIMQDEVGGTTQLIMRIVSDVLMATGFVYRYSSGEFNSLSLYADNKGKVDEQKMMTGSIIMAVGEALLTVQIIYNIVRSSTYNTSSFDTTAWNISVFPSRNGSIDKVQLSYTLRF